MLNVASYIKNLGKSVTYSSLDLAAKVAPSSSSLITTNQELFKEIYHSVRDYRTTLKRATAVFEGSKVYEAADVGFHAIMEDIQTGKFYNRDRESAMQEKSGGAMFDMSGMDISVDDGFDESAFDMSDMGVGDQYVADTVAKSSRASADMISTTIAKSAKYTVDSQRMSTNILFAQNAKLMGNINSNILGMSGVMDNLFKFNTTTVQTHAENSKTYFENSTKMMQEQNAILKEMLEMQRNDYKERQDGKPKEKAEPKKKLRFGDIVTAEGAPDIKGYFDNVAGNIKSIMSEHGADMLFGEGMGEGSNLLLNFVSNPLRIIPDLFVKSLIGPNIARAAKNLDKTISGVFGTMIARLNKAAKDDDGSLISQTLGRIFGIRDTVKSSLDTNNYEKGAVPFDGIVKKSIVEVMPTYLRQIVSILSGKPERIFDHATGKWENTESKDSKYANNLGHKWSSIRDENVNAAFSDMSDTMGKYNSQLTHSSRKEKEEYYKDFNRVLHQIYADGGDFNLKSKKEDKYLDYGVSEQNFAIIEKLFSKMPKHLLMQMGGNIQEQRTRENKQKEDMEKETSIFNALFNGSEVNSYIAKDKDDKFITKTGVLGNDITLKLDDKGHNLFYYLQNMYKELTYVRRFGTGIGGPAAFANTTAEITDRSGNIRTINTNPRADIDSVVIENIAGKSVSQRRRDEENKADERFNNNEAKRRERARNKGQYLGYIDPEKEYKQNTITAAVAFQDKSDEIDREDARQSYEDMPWTWRMMQDEAQAMRDRNKTNLESANKDKAGKSFISKLIAAGTLGEKYALIQDGVDNLMSAPGAMLTKVLTQADQSIYDFFFAKETDVKDANGNTINGFFNRMVYEMKGTFTKINNWLDATIFDPLKKRMDADTMGGVFKNGLKMIGIDTDEIKRGIGEFFKPVGDAIKESFSNAFKVTKSSVASTYQDIQNALNPDGRQAGPDTAPELTQEQIKARVASIKAKTASDTEMFEERVNNKKNEISNTQLATTDAGKAIELKRQQKQIDKLNKELEKFKNIDARSNSLKTAVSNMGPDTEADIAKKNKRAENEQEIAKLKSIIIEGDSDFAELETKMKTLEAEIPSLLTEKEKLEKRIETLEANKQKIYEKTGISETDMKDNFDYTSHMKKQLSASNAKINKLKSKATMFDADGNPVLVGEDLEAFTNEKKLKQTIREALSDYTKYTSQNAEDNQGLSDRDVLKKDIALIASFEKKYKTKDIQKKINSLISQDEYKLNDEMLDDNTKSTISARLEQRKKHAERINRAKGNLNSTFKNRFSDMFKLMGVDDTTDSSTLIEQIMAGNDSAKLDNYTLTDLANHTADGRHSKINKTINDFMADRRIEATNSWDANDTDQIKHLLTQLNLNPDAEHGLINPADPNQTANHGLLTDEDINERTITLAEKNKDIAESSNDYLKKMVDGIGNLANKLDGVITAISGMNIGSHAKGARYVKKTGLTAITEGEMIIPSDMNPLNPNRDNVDREQEIKNEQAVKTKYSKDLANSIFDSIRENANGDQPIDPNDKPGIFAQGVNNIKAGTKEFTESIFGSHKAITESIENIGGKVKQYAPKAIGNGLLFGSLGLATGLAAPLIAAVGGAAVSIASNSGQIQNWLFGDELVDKDGVSKGRAGGVFSKDTQDLFKKYMPDFTKYGITGTLAGMLTPLGPLGGLIIGSGITFAKNNERMQNMLFGDEDGLLNADRKALITKAIPNISTAVLGTVLLGPFGIVGNAVLGTGIGLLSTTEEFKTFMLGEADENGKRTGGLAGSIKLTFVDPLTQFAKTLKDGMLDFIEKDLVNPLKRAIAPIGKDIKMAVGYTFNKVGDFINNMFTDTLGVPLSSWVRDKLINPTAKITNAALKLVTTPAKAILSAPSKAIGWYGDKRRAAHIRSGSADYMTADERIEFRDAKGMKADKMSNFDRMIANASREDLTEIHQAVGTIKGGKGFLENEEQKAIDALGSVVDKHAEGGFFSGVRVNDKVLFANERDRIIKLVQAGEVEAAQKAIFASKSMGRKDQEKLSKLVQEKGEALRKIRYQKENYTDNRETMYSKLANDLGIEGINDGNIDKYYDLLSHEKTAKLKSDAAYKEGDSQYKAITDALDNNSQELLEEVKKMVATLEAIKNGTDIMTEEQKRENEELNKRTESSRESYGEVGKNKLAHRSKTIESIYGENTLSEDSKYSLADNEHRFDKLKQLGNKNYKFKDINTLLSMKEKDFQRLTELASLGYNISDYHKISKLSDEGYLNIQRLAKLGYKFTSFDKIAKLDPDQIGYIEEMIKAGYNHENMSFENMINPEMRKKKTQLLENPEHFKAAGYGAKGETAQESGPITRVHADAGKKIIRDTPDGPMEYVISNDGSEVLAKTKDNKDVADKREDRDKTQKGIFEKLGSLSNSITGWVKKALGLGDKKKEEKPWWQQLLELLGVGGVIYGALSILPNIKSSIDSGKNLVVEAIHGVTDKVEQVLNWVKKKFAVTGDNEEDMGTRLEGAAVRAGVRVAPNYIRAAMKADKLARMYGTPGTLSTVNGVVGRVANFATQHLNPMNVVENTKSAVSGAWNVAKKAANGVNGELVASMKDKASKIAGNITNSSIVNDVIKQPTQVAKNAWNGASKFLEGLSEDAITATKGKTTKVITDIAESSPALTKFLSGVKGYLEGMLTKIKLFVPNKAVGNGVLKFFDELMKELAEKAPAKLGKITASISTAGIFNIIDGFGGFISGYQDVNSIFGITHGATDGMKLCTGLMRSLNNLLAFGIIPEKWMMNAIIDYVGPAAGFDMSTIQALRKESEDEVASYNSKNGKDLSVEQYNKEVLNDKTIFERFNDSAIMKFVKEKGSEGASAVWQGIKKAGTWAYDNLSSLIGGIIDIGGFVFDTVTTNVQMAFTNDDTELDAIKPPTIDPKDPLSGIKSVLFYGIRASLLIPTLVVKTGVWLFDALKPVGKALLEIGGGVLTDSKSAFDLAMQGRTGDMWANNSNTSDGITGGIRSAIGFIPRLVLTPMSLINQVMNSMINNGNPVIQGLVGVAGAVGDSVTSMFNAAILGDYSGVFNMPDINTNAPGIVNDIAALTSITTKVLLAPITIALSPIGLVYRGISGLLDGISNSGIISQDEKTRIETGDVSLMDILNPTSTYWATGDVQDNGNPMTMLGWIGNKIYKMMMAPVAMFRSIFNSVGSSVDEAKNWVGEKFKWLGKYFGTTTPEDSSTPNAKGKYGRGSESENKMAKVLENKFGVPANSDMDTGISIPNVTKTAINPNVAKFTSTTQPVDIDDKAEDYNKIQPDDSMTVVNAKLKAQYEQKDQRENGKFYSQIDPKYNMKFNTSGDTSAQTMKDSGCGPVSASNVVSAITGQNLDPRAAAQYALSNGYKEKDGGTKPDYFSSLLSKYGINSNYESTKTGIANRLQNGDPVVLMGTDVNARGKTPFGNSPHYVVGTGLDGNGNMIVQDPESRTPNLTYNMKDVLNSTNIGIAASAKGKYGKGSGIIQSIKNSISGKGKYGRGGDNGQIAWDYLIKQGFSSNAAAGILGNLMQESGLEPRRIEGGGVGNLSIDGKTGYGIAQWTSSDRQQNLQNWAMSHGGDPGDLSTQLSFLRSEMSDDLVAKMNSAGSVDAATELFCKEFERPGTPMMSNRKKYASDAFANQGKGLYVAGKNMPGNNKAKKKYDGLFGIFDAINDTVGASMKRMLYGSDGENGSTGASQAGNMQTNNTAGNAADWMLANLKGSTITSKYKEQRANGWHHGIDYGADTGTSIPSPVNGKMTMNTTQDGYGNLAVVTDKNGQDHIFGHMDSRSSIPVGSDVKKGDIIGPVGSTGHSSGPHLHYEVQKDGVQGNDLDPGSYNISGLGKDLYKAPASIAKINNTPSTLPTSARGKEKYGKGGDRTDDYVEILNMIIAILTSIASNTSKLTQIHTLLSDNSDIKSDSTTNDTSRKSTTSQNPGDSISNIKNKLKRLYNTSGGQNGMGDLLMNKDTDFILNTMQSIATE